MQVLETERLILRPFRLADREKIHRLVYADPQVAPGWTGKTWAIDEVSESFARKLDQHPNELDFQAIVRKATRELIGLIGFQLYAAGEIDEYMIFEHAASRLTYDPVFFEVELTYALGYAFWHKGYATEAGQALIEHGFGVLNIGRIVNSVAEENVASVKLMQRLGLSIECNGKPKPLGGPWQNSPGVIGILTNPHWQRRVAALPD